jgi:TPP-dependent pyruvate/acetoin dehydrogenase alpha subunit
MYRRWLIERAKIDESELRRIEEEAEGTIDAAVDYAEALPLPRPETVTDRLFAPSPHDPRPEDRRELFEPIEKPAIPALTATKERGAGGHF